MIAAAAVRGLELIATVIVLALSITAVRWQYYGKAPAVSGYNAFAGAWGLLFTLIGFVALFVSAIPGIIMGALDLLTFIILLAGGIAYAVQLRGVNCNNANDVLGSPSSNPLNYNILNGGIYTNDNWDHYIGNFPVYGDSNDPRYDVSVLKSRCNTALADTAFLFIGCIAALVAGILTIAAHRRGGGRHAAV